MELRQQEELADISDAVLDTVDFFVNERSTGRALNRLSEMLRAHGVTADDILDALEGE